MSQSQTTLKKEKRSDSIQIPSRKAKRQSFIALVSNRRRRRNRGGRRNRGRRKVCIFGEINEKNSEFFLAGYLGNMFKDHSTKKITANLLVYKSVKKKEKNKVLRSWQNVSLLSLLQ